MPALLTVEHRVGATSKGPSPSSRLVSEVVRHLGGPSTSRNPIAGIANFFAPALDAVAHFRGLPEGVTVEEITFAQGFRGEIVYAENSSSSMHDGVVLYIHGGNLLGGERSGSGFATHRTVVAQLATRCAMPVLSVDYSRPVDGEVAPSVADCLAAYGWLVEHKAPADSIVVIGDGIGAHIAFSTVLRAAIAGLDAPAGLVSLSGRFKPDRRGEFLGAPGLAALNVAVSTLPTTLFVGTEAEIADAQSDTVTERLIAGGVACKLQVWQGQPSSFVASFPNLPESQMVISDVARFVMSRMAQAELERQTA